MAKRPPKKDAERGVVRRSASERKRLPPDLEAFAGGDDDALWRRPTSPRLRDPRAVVLMPGVANRDARAVYEHRLRRLERALADGDDRRAAIELAEAAQLEVWRGHSIVGWDAFAEDVLGLSRNEAAELLEVGAREIGAKRASDEVIAVWMRTEAGLIEAGADAHVGLREGRLVIDVPIGDAPAALAAAGRRIAPLAREQAEAPREVIDRPKGVPRAKRDAPPRED
jgi:hypothetical protein